MNLIKVFLLAVFMAGAGAGIGGALGTKLGRGGLLIGALVLGMALVILSGFLSERWKWIRHEQRLWAILGGAYGFALAWVVAVATIANPRALPGAAAIVGMGMALGAVAGTTRHLQS